MWLRQVSLVGVSAAAIVAAPVCAKADENPGQDQASIGDSTAWGDYDEVKIADRSNLFFSNSVLLIPNLLTRRECRVLMDAVEKELGRPSRPSYGQGFAEDVFRVASRFLGIPIQVRPLERFRICDLSHEAKELSAAVLHDRLLPYIEQYLPQVGERLFGQSQGLQDLQFSFSPKEPAVNRYMEGGEFKVHRDGYSMTVNVLLSDSGAFEGGGTEFWQEGKVEINGSRSKVLIRPCQGTGVVFNGDVEHLGRPVESGIRHLYVASFQLDQPFLKHQELQS